MLQIGVLVDLEVQEINMRKIINDNEKYICLTDLLKSINIAIEEATRQPQWKYKQYLLGLNLIKKLLEKHNEND